MLNLVLNLVMDILFISWSIHNYKTRDKKTMDTMFIVSWGVLIIATIYNMFLIK